MVPLKIHYFGGSAWLIQYNIIQSIHVKCPVTCWENGYFPRISTIDSNLLPVDRLQNTRLLRKTERLFEHGRKLLSQTITGRWPAKLQTKKMRQPDDPSVIVVLNFWEVTDWLLIVFSKCLDFIHTSPCSNRYLTLNPVDLFEQRLPQNLMLENHVPYQWPWFDMIWATCINSTQQYYSVLPCGRPH